jgi:pimeloyl-ACP methyl ester carboxylesterase
MLFEPVLKELSPELAPRVVPLPNNSPLDYKDLIPVVSSLLPVAEPYFLLGESFSGPLSLMIAATRPTGLQGVVLCASFIRNPTCLPSVLQHFLGTRMFHATPLFVQAKALFAGHGTSDLLALLRRAHARVPPAVMAQRIRSILTLDCKAALRTCPVPVAYLRGTRDRVVPSRNCREILAANPLVREYAIRAPHLILQTQPRAAAEAIEAFIRDVGGACRLQ